MLKKVILLLLSTSLLIGSENKNCICKNQSDNKFIIIGSILAVGTAAVIAAPFVLPAGTIVVITTTGTAIATKIAVIVVPTTTIGQISSGLSITHAIRPYIIETTEEKLNVLLEERALKPFKVKTEFIHCLKANKINSQRDASGRPTACDEIALRYALTVGISELNQRTEAFNNNKCYCS